MELEKVSIAAAGGKRRGDVRHADTCVDFEQPSARPDGEAPGLSMIPVVDRFAGG